MIRKPASIDASTSSPHNVFEGHQYRSDAELVVASLEAEDTSWISTHLPDWYSHIYIVDNPRARLRVPENKGREAMVYLTHIIDHYSNLPPKVGIYSQVGVMNAVPPELSS